jgi:alpha-mannosidase
MSAKLTNLMEQPEGSALPIDGGNTIHVPVHPYEIVTVAADYAPPAQ